MDNTFNDIVLEKFSGTEPEEDAENFLRSCEHRIKVTLGRIPANGDERQNYLFRQRALFASLLRGAAQEWYIANIDETNNAHNWDHVKREFSNRFTDGRDRYRFRIQAENVKRLESEPIKTYLQRVKKIVDKGWPTIYAAGADEAARTAADNAMQVHRTEKYISLGSKGLIPSSLKNCAYKRMLEHPGTTWEELKTHLINKDLCYAMSTDGESSNSNSKLTNIETQLKELKESLQNQSINAVNLNPHNPRMNQNFTRFCKICRKEGHTMMYCWKRQNQTNFQNQNSNRQQQYNNGDYSNRNFRPPQGNQNQSNNRNFGPRQNFNQNRPQNQNFQNQNRFQQRNGPRNNSQSQRNYNRNWNNNQNANRQNNPGYNQNRYNQNQNSFLPNPTNNVAPSETPNAKFSRLSIPT